MEMARHYVSQSLRKKVRIMLRGKLKTCATSSATGVVLSFIVIILACVCPFITIKTRLIMFALGWINSILFYSILRILDDITSQAHKGATNTNDAEEYNSRSL